MHYAGKAGQAQGTWTGREPYSTWQESMGLHDGRVNENWKSSVGQSEQNFCHTYVIMQFWSKNKVESSTKYSDLEKEFDSTGLLSVIKKLVYTGGTNDLNVSHNKVVHMNLMNLYQDKFQDIQEFRDQWPFEKCAMN